MIAAARPAHVIAVPGDRHSLCGIKEPVPVVAAEFVAMHVAGWGMHVCVACAAAAHAEVVS
jgi:hypothetical protein